MTTLESHIATLAIFGCLGLLTWLNWRWKKHMSESFEQKQKDWEKCFNHRMDSHGNMVKRFTEERLQEFKSELKPKCRPRTASQKRKAPSLLKIKKIR